MSKFRFAPLDPARVRLARRECDTDPRSLDHDQAACIARGNPLGTDDYTRRMMKLGHKEGYLVAEADDGHIVFALPGMGGITQLVTPGPV